jgi:hypothetical protein
MMMMIDMMGMMQAEHHLDVYHQYEVLIDLIHLIDSIVGM